MKITAVETVKTSLIVNPQLAIVSAAGTHPESHYLTVRIRTDEGMEGFGEATLAPVWSGESQDGAAAAIRNILAPVLEGKDPRNVRALAAAMDRALIGNPFTKAAMEMALLDLKAKSLGTGVCNLLGGPQRSLAISLKFSIGAFSPAEAARVARHAAELGLRAVKVKVGLHIKTDLERVSAVRSELGEDFSIAVDANAGWTESEATLALAGLEKLNVNAFEQPLRRGDFRGCARLRAKTHIPIMLDESIFTVQDAMEAIRLDSCDLISIYPGKNGGILRSLAIAEMAHAAGLKCIIGSNLEMDLGTAAMLHLAVAIPALSETVSHDIIGPLYYTQHLTDTPIRYKDGCALLPEGTGLGVNPR
ncbi:MAG: mandelate racemase/muconate lactonizing protein [Acidobacteria bacterium]|nr:mandelate racemase/muconate lactonizing protein [Acidobacteriota bacterium]